jgi:phenylalanyl-tRNA synthetase beta subunit
VTYGDVIAAVQSALTSSYMQTVISPVDIYRPDSSQAKNITIRISFVADDHTLTGDEVAAEMSRIVDTVVTALHATVI